MVQAGGQAGGRASGRAGGRRDGRDSGSGVARPPPQVERCLQSVMLVLSLTSGRLYVISRPAGRRASCPHSEPHFNAIMCTAQSDPGGQAATEAAATATATAGGDCGGVSGV